MKLFIVLCKVVWRTFKSVGVILKQCEHSKKLKLRCKSLAFLSLEEDSVRNQAIFLLALKDKEAPVKRRAKPKIGSRNMMNAIIIT